MSEDNEKVNECRQKLLDAAVNLTVIEGCQRLTMKAVAREAGVSDKEAYRHFASLEKLFESYYEQRAEQALHEYHQTEGLEEFETLEKMQLLFDTFLETLVPDREFLIQNMQQVSKTSCAIQRGKKLLKKTYHAEFKQLLDAAVKKEEYPDNPKQICDCLTHHLMGIMMYWLRDSSEGGKRSTKLIELSLIFADSTFKSGSLNALHDLKLFLVKPLIVGAVKPLEGFIERLRQMRDLMGKDL